MKLDVVLFPCPWCKKTPNLFMPMAEETWIWKVYCCHGSCKVSIRKTSKTKAWRLKNKVEQLARKWNTELNTIPYEMKVIDLAPIEKNFIEGFRFN